MKALLLRLFEPGVPRRARRTVAAVALLAPLVLGCPQEVPYEDPADGGGEEAPAFEPPPADDPAPDGSPAPAEEVAAEPVPVEQPDPDQPVDRYATGPSERPSRLPWESDDAPTESSPDAEQLFGGLSDPAPAEPDPPAAEAPPAEGAEDSFSAILDSAYSDLLDKPADPKPDPKPEPEPAETASSGLPFGDPEDDLFGTPEPTPTPTPEPTTPEPVAESASPPAKAPTTTQPADSDLLSELWGESGKADPAPEPEPVPEPDPAAPVAADEPPAFDASSLFDEPEEEPLEEPEPVRVADASPAPRPAPMAGAASPPLPSVPVLPYNTRHLAWLLGAKMSLAELADLDAATPSEVAAWRDEVDRLARELRVPNPIASAEHAADPAARVRDTMRAAAEAGDTVAAAHGVDHAALLEIALKTNALLVVAKDRPDLAAPVGGAVRSAAERALLPRFLWKKTVTVFEGDPTGDEVYDAVVELHQRVESFLR